jgi:hypothetical protein
MHLPWFEARLHLSSAEAYRLRQQPGDLECAATHLNQALSLFEALRAQGYVDRVHAQLATFNLQPATATT